MSIYVCTYVLVSVSGVVGQLIFRLVFAVVQSAFIKLLFQLEWSTGWLLNEAVLVVSKQSFVSETFFFVVERDDPLVVLEHIWDIGIIISLGTCNWSQEIAVVDFRSWRRQIFLVRLIVGETSRHFFWWDRDFGWGIKSGRIGLIHIFLFFCRGVKSSYCAPVGHRRGKVVDRGLEGWFFLFVETVG